MIHERRAEQISALLRLREPGVASRNVAGRGGPSRRNRFLGSRRQRELALDAVSPLATEAAMATYGFMSAAAKRYSTRVEAGDPG